jgi:hypothetical protein
MTTRLHYPAMRIERKLPASPHFVVPIPGEASEQRWRAEFRRPTTTTVANRTMATRLWTSQTHFC